MLVGLPTAMPSHQKISAAVASPTERRRTSMPGTRIAPPATQSAIAAVWPEALS